MKKVLAGPLATVKRGIPVLQWLPLYDAEKGISDLIAGITVALTLIPQSIAYAALAGLGPEVSFSNNSCVHTDVVLPTFTWLMLEELIAKNVVLILLFILIAVLSLGKILLKYCFLVQILILILILPFF